LGLRACVAHIEGDDLRGKLAAITPSVDGSPNPMSVNAYLGGWGSPKPSARARTSW
jgi:hypothetical protein